MARSLRKLQQQTGATHTSGGFKAAALMVAFTSGRCKLCRRYSIVKIHDAQLLKSQCAFLGSPHNDSAATREISLRVNARGPDRM
mmetsp:Transcript_183/g.488  ORF Transcript_183/g.488 Transcript_183/m.488 type:complete len:85 (-) Transcript_183:24-278(-)